MKKSIVELTRRALPLMQPAHRAEAEALIAALDAEDKTAFPADVDDADPDTLAEFTKRAAAAFGRDMQPICNAVAAALHDGDTKALQALKTILPNLLERVNERPALADLLAHQMGKAFLDGITGEGQTS